MSLWQTPEWNNMLEKTWQVEKYIFIWNIYIQKRQISLKQYGLFCMGVKQSQITDSFLAEAKSLCKQEKSLFLQIESLDYNGDSELSWKDFKKWYYKKFITPYTAIIDLWLSEDEILALMKPKGRYNIRLAAKKWINITFPKKTNDNIKIFHELSSETTKRDNFSWHSFEYYKKFLNLLEHSALIFASNEGRVIAAGIFTFNKNSSYYYYWASTSDSKYRNMMAPYLLQWSAIQHAKKIESKIYDFLWISGEWDYYDASLAWVTDFKKKLSKNNPLVSESLIYLHSPLRYSLLNILRKLK